MITDTEYAQAVPSLECCIGHLHRLCAACSMLEAGTACGRMLHVCGTWIHTCTCEARCRDWSIPGGCSGAHTSTSQHSALGPCCGYCGTRVVGGAAGAYAAPWFSKRGREGKRFCIVQNVHFIVEACSVEQLSCAMWSRSAMHPFPPTHEMGLMDLDNHSAHAPWSPEAYMHSHPARPIAMQDCD